MSDRTQRSSQNHSANRLRVMKFGGTSVQDAEAIRRVVRIVRDGLESDRSARVVVSSACAGVTDQLVACAEACREGAYQTAHQIVDRLAEQHEAILADLLSSSADRPDPEASEGIATEIDRLRRLVEGSSLLGETTPRTHDALLASGELLSTRLLRTAFLHEGIDAERLLSHEILITDEHHGAAGPDLERTRNRATASVLPALERSPVVILQGFLGGTPAGVMTTLGRGGSDYSAALFGSALEAEAIEIWTDVDGIMTADPRIVEAARPIERITFSGARELAWYGAKVIHPDTILPAVEQGIPVVIRNSHNPRSTGTTILPDSEPIEPGIYSVTGRRNLILLEITTPPPGSTGRDRHTDVSADAPDHSPAELHGLIASRDVPILLAVIAESSLSLVIPSEAWREPFRTVLESTAPTVVHRDIALICLSGSSVRSTPALLAEPLQALRGTPIRLLGAGSSDYSILMALDGDDHDSVLRRLHDILF